MLFTDKKIEPKKDTKLQTKLKDDNKENIPNLSATKSTANLLKSYKSSENLKKMQFKEHELRRAFEIGQSLKALIDPK